MIPIALACDDKYFPPMLVTLYSLLKNAFPSTCYHIFVLKDSFSEQQNQALNKLSVLFPKNCLIEKYIVNSTPFDYIEKNERLTSPNFYRFNLIELIKDYPKIIWCDTDIIIQGDLTDYYNIDIEDNFILAVEAYFDNIPYYVNYYKSLKMQRAIKGPLYNVGFLTFNLDKMRRENFLSKLHQWYKQYPLNTTEQPMWNLCDGKVKFTHLKYNYMAMGEYTIFYSKVYLGDIQTLKNLSSREIDIIKEAAASPVVIHYAYAKPWDIIHRLYYVPTPFADIWWQYYKESPFFDFHYYLRQNQKALENGYQILLDRERYAEFQMSFWHCFGLASRTNKIKMLVNLFFKKFILHK